MSGVCSVTMSAEHRVHDVSQIKITRGNLVQHWCEEEAVKALLIISDLQLCNLAKHLNCAVRVSELREQLLIIFQAADGMRQ